MKYGFIGTGEITKAIVTGMCTTDNPPETIWVSPRNRNNAARLANTFAPVQVGGSNQDVLDQCDVIVLAVLPHQKEAILNPLRFRSDQTVIHLLAGTPIDDVAPLVAPAGTIIRAVPLPCTAIHKGPIAVYPQNPRASALFDPLGTVISLATEAQLETLSIVTALIAPYYAFVRAAVDWADKEGIQRRKATTFTASMFEALSAIAGDSQASDIDELIDRCMTPDGLNEQAMVIINENGGFSSLTAALDRVKEKSG